MEPALSAEPQPTPPPDRTDAVAPEIDRPPPEGDRGGGGSSTTSRLFGKEPLDMDRLQTDPAYRRAYEDWLDLQENLTRTPAETRRTDLMFVASFVVLTGLLILLLYWLLR